MTNEEFSNEFDVLYNSITSNQAPGLDEYEKSVFLTKAQNEIVKSYFNPRSNKTQEGYDGSEKRQIDFSMVTKSESFVPVYVGGNKVDDWGDLDPGEYDFIVDSKEDFDKITSSYKLATEPPKGYTPLSTFIYLDRFYTTYTPFKDPFFDNRDNTKSIKTPSNILMFINEYVIVDRQGKATRLNVVPVAYTEYNRLMSKPYKRPLKNQAWRIIDNSDDTSSFAEIVVGPNDTTTKYVCRYVKRPQAIRLIDFEDGLTIDGGSTYQECELDPITHPEILQRGVELAKAVYAGDLTSQIALGQSSQTDIGFVQSNNQR